MGTLSLTFDRKFIKNILVDHRLTVGKTVLFSKIINRKCALSFSLDLSTLLQSKFKSQLKNLIIRTDCYKLRIK